MYAASLPALDTLLQSCLSEPYVFSLTHIEPMVVLVVQLKFAVYFINLCFCSFGGS